jgi:hypothetical protein
MVEGKAHRGLEMSRVHKAKHTCYKEDRREEADCALINQSPYLNSTLAMHKGNLGEELHV